MGGEIDGNIRDDSQDFDMSNKVNVVSSYSGIGYPRGMEIKVFVSNV